MPLINVGLSKERNFQVEQQGNRKPTFGSVIEGADSLETIPLLSRSQVKQADVTTAFRYVTLGVDEKSLLKCLLVSSVCAIVIVTSGSSSLKNLATVAYLKGPLDPSLFNGKKVIVVY
ncbi:hypothetical protein ACHAXS_000475 [Conticribra weissflogii]